MKHYLAQATLSGLVTMTMTGLLKSVIKITVSNEYLLLFLLGFCSQLISLTITHLYEKSSMKEMKYSFMPVYSYWGYPRFGSGFGFGGRHHFGGKHH